MRFLWTWCYFFRFGYRIFWAFGKPIVCPFDAEADDDANVRAGTVLAEIIDVIRSRWKKMLQNFRRKTVGGKNVEPCQRVPLAPGKFEEAAECAEHVKMLHAEAKAEFFRNVVVPEKYPRLR